MFAHLRGKITSLSQSNSSTVIEVNGIGYLVFVAQKHFVSLGPNKEITLYISSVFRDTEIRLFGFLENSEKELFEKLIKVSGIGPKAAINIINMFSVKDFISAVIRNESKTLSSAPGIGKKTAERLILELKNEFKKIGQLDSGQNSQGNNVAFGEATNILSGLGFSHADIQSKLNQAQQNDINEDVESLVKYCLQN